MHIHAHTQTVSRSLLCPLLGDSQASSEHQILEQSYQHHTIIFHKGSWLISRASLTFSLIFQEVK